MPTKRLQEQPNGSKNDLGIGFEGPGVALSLYSSFTLSARAGELPGADVSVFISRSFALSLSLSLARYLVPALPLRAAKLSIADVQVPSSLSHAPPPPPSLAFPEGKPK